MKDLLAKLAKHSYKKHAFLKEWRVFILITLVVKLAAMLFSIFAGFFYFDNVFMKLLNSSFWAAVFAGTNLILIEILTAIAISKFFKFVIRGTWKTAIPILIIVIGLFSVSFISSTRGLALRQSDKVDNIELITNQYEYKINATKSDYQERAEVIKARIKDEQNNPQGWTGGQRTTLLIAQLDRIDKYYQDLKTLVSERKKSLSLIYADHRVAKQANRNTMETEANKFYNIVAAIMALIFLINGLLMFFYSKIFEEKESELSKVEVLENIGEEMQTKTASLIENTINSQFNMYFNAFARVQDNTERGNITRPPEAPQIGFIPPTAKTVNQNDNRRSPSDQRLCKNCGKPFDFKHWNKQFCADECRIQFWENKNNKVIHRKTYKK